MPAVVHPCLRSSSCSRWNGPADSAGSSAPPPAPQCASAARRSSPERRTGELAGWTPGWTGCTGSEGAPAPQVLGQQVRYFNHQHIPNIFIQDLLTDLRSYNPKYSELSYKIMVLIGGHVSYTWSTIYHLLALVQVVAGWSLHALLQGKRHLIGVKIQASPSSSFFCWRCRWWRCLSFIVFF